jgi:hypothetical protein
VFRCLAPISLFAHPVALIDYGGGVVGWSGRVGWVGCVGAFLAARQMYLEAFHAGVVADAARKSSASKLLASVGLDTNAAGDLYMGASGRRVSIHTTANLLDMVSICLPPCLPACICLSAHLRQCAAAPATVPLSVSVSVLTWQERQVHSIFLLRGSGRRAMSQQVVAVFLYLCISYLCISYLCISVSVSVCLPLYVACLVHSYGPASD